MMEDAVLENLCGTADGFYRRGRAFGSTGNISVRAGERVRHLTPEQVEELKRTFG